MQRQLARSIVGVSVVSIFDVGLSDVIHNNSSANLVIGERTAAAALGSAYSIDVKHLHPEISTARMISDTNLELVFDDVDVRLNYENMRADQPAFAVRDQNGNVGIKSCLVTAPNIIQLMLSRPPTTQAYVIGAPSAYPPAALPLDISGFRPMLAFTVDVEPATAPCLNSPAPV